MEKTELEKYIESQGGYSRMEASRLKYLTEYYKKKEKEDLEKNEKALYEGLKESIISIMTKPKYEKNFHKCCSIARNVIDSLEKEWEQKATETKN